MPETEILHLRCEISEETSQSFLPPLSRHANCIQKLCRAFKKSTLISERNPQCGHYYRSVTEVLKIREEHVRKHKRLLIHPFSVFRLWYEFYMAFIFLVCLLYMPFDAAFDTETLESPGFIDMNAIVCFTCYLDVVLRFYTGTVNRRERIVSMDRKEIAKRYLLSIHFYADVISALPDASLYVSNKYGRRVIDTFQLLKIFRIKTMFDYFTRMAEYFNVKNGYFDAIRLLLLIVITVHWMGCTCYLVPQMRKTFYGEYHRHSWVVYWKIFPPISMVDVYVKCIYRASGYFLGVRIETHEHLPSEEAVMTCCMFAIGKVFSYTLVVIVVQRLLMVGSFETKYQEIIEQVKGFISSHHLPPKMMTKLLVLYRYKYHKTYFNEEKITKMLTESLRKEVNAQALSRLSETVTIFAELPEYDLLNLLAQLHGEIFLPHDVIIKAGEVGDCMYFLASGTVAVSTPSGKEVCHLYDGAYFGEICLVLKDHSKRIATVIALEICEVYKLSRRGFRACLRDEKELRKKMEVESMKRIEMTQAYEDLHKGAFMDLTNM